MSRKWLYALAAMAAVTLAMFPLNLLLVGKSPLHAFIRSLLFGLPALLTIWTPKGRKPGHEGRPPKRLSRPAKIVCGTICVAVLGAMFVHDACASGIGVGITNAVGFVMLILVTALGYRLGYLKI